MNFFGLIEQGGIFMAPLLLGSMLAIGLGTERLIHFLKLEKGGAGYREGLLALVRNGQVSKALESVKGKSGVVAEVASAALENWEATPEMFDLAVARAARLGSKPYSRFMPVFETTVTAAPLIGLLGTITGMMGVFRVVAQKLANDPNANTTGITAGIGEALIATATGILVAVLALFIHNIFQSWTDAQLDEAERVAEELRMAHRSRSVTHAAVS